MAALRQSMAWLHTWTGLVMGWILFAMFLTGGASFFRPEITRWMQPEVAMPGDPDRAVIVAVAHMQRLAPPAESWTFIPPDARQATTRVFWRDARLGPGRAAFQDRELDGATGAEIAARETRGGEFFYRFHFQLQMPHPWGRWLAGVAAMSMLVAIVSGVITHKRIFQDFFTFRPGKAGQRSWLDGHNLLAVAGLPFHLMITYTGMITLMLMYMPWGISAAYEKRGDYLKELQPQAAEVEASGRAAPLAPIGPMLAAAHTAWDGGRIGRVVIRHPGDAAAVVELHRHDGDQLSIRGETLVFDGVSGRLTQEIRPHGAAAITAGALYGLHMGRFADPALRWAYFLCSLAGGAMVATGLVLWDVKRRPALAPGQRLPFGHRLVEVLNVAVIAGTPLAMGAFLWANRLLPVGAPGRGDAEVRAVFIVCGLALLYAMVRPARRAWVELFAASALVVGLTPLLSTLTTRWNLVERLLAGDVAMAAFDATLLALGALLALIAWKAAVRRPAPVRARTPVPAPAE